MQKDAFLLYEKVKTWFSKEWFIQLILWILYFLVLAYQKDRASLRSGGPSSLAFSDFVFALNYFVMVVIINYHLLPRFFYRRRYGSFLLFSLLTMMVAILVEEFLLEPILLSGTPRGEHFPGYMHVFLGFGPTLLFFVGFKLAWDNLEKQTQIEQLGKEKTESQLQFLKSQLNPHFLFNNLNNLYSYAQEKSPKTPDIIMQLSAIMRYMLYESRENYVLLEKELGYLQDFILLQEMQMEGRGEVIFNNRGETEGKLIAPMILIAFVENCFKHSLSSQAEGILIQISVETDNNELTFEALNTFNENGTSSKEFLSKGIGLENVQKRLELQYPGRYELDIQVKEDLYITRLKLDLGYVD